MRIASEILILLMMILILVFLWKVDANVSKIANQLDIDIIEINEIID